MTLPKARLNAHRIDIDFQWFTIIMMSIACVLKGHAQVYSHKEIGDFILA